MRAFMTDDEFNQASIDNVARMVSERSSAVIATGNVADVGQDTLAYLECIASDLALSPFVVSTYHDIIRAENEEIINFL